eukprot:2111863-Prymnesium_polylepis.1
MVAALRPAILGALTLLRAAAHDAPVSGVLLAEAVALVVERFQLRLTPPAAGAGAGAGDDDAAAATLGV